MRWCHFNFFNVNKRCGLHLRTRLLISRAFKNNVWNKNYGTLSVNKLLFFFFLFRFTIMIVLQ